MLLDLLGTLHHFGENKEEEEEKESEQEEGKEKQDDPKKLNHDHFFQICEQITKKNVKLQEKLKNQGVAEQDANEYIVPTEENIHRKLIKEVTRLLKNDEEGIKSIEEDPELIQMLNVDILLDSPDPKSQDIARAYG